MDDNKKILAQDPAKSGANIGDYEEAYRNFDWNKSESELVEFFDDGKLNLAYNCIDRHLADKADKLALIYAGADGSEEKYTFAQMKSESNKFANVLKSQGVNKGDRVFIFMPTIPERYFAFLGILKTGAIAGTMFAAFQELALTDRLADSTASVVVTTPELYPRINAIKSDLPALKKIIVVERNGELPEGEGVISYSQESAKASEDFDVEHMDKEEYSYMLYTSGTTGKPKGVVHAHGDMVQAITSTSYALDVKDNDIYWCTADLGWVTGVVYGVIGIWGLGGTSLITDGRFSPESWYGLIEKYKVTIWYSAPTAIRMLMGAEKQPKDFDLSSLRHLASVGEPLNPEAIWWGYDAFGLAFHDTWWQTELGSISITNYPSMDVKPGSMGKPLPGVYGAVIDDSGNELPAGKEGDLVLRKDSVKSIMKTVWNNQAKFDSYFMDDWYISGDRAIKDEDGYFWFVGRADDVINTAGERVGPFEVESALVEHPYVIEAGVIGKPDEVRGQIIKAFVVTTPGIEQNDELKDSIAQHVKKHLAGHAYPREIEFIDKLPKTRSGKIMRRILKSKELGEDIGDTSTLEDY